MSSELAGIVQFEETMRTTNSVSAACFALAVYELCITFADEVRIVWQGRATAATLLCIVNRWTLLAYALDNALGIISLPRLTSLMTYCKITVIMLAILQILSLLVVAVFTALRVSAIWNFNKILFIVVFSLSIVQVITNIYGSATGEWATYTFPGTGIEECVLAYRVSPQVDIAMLFLSRLTAILADVIAFAFTLLKTARQVREARRLHLPSSLSGCVIRDGTIYFAALLTLNVLRLVISGASIQVDLSPVVPLLEALPQVLIGRFMMNLRHASDASAMPLDTQNSSIHFRMPTNVFGSIAEPLEHGDHSHGDEDW